MATIQIFTGGNVQHIRCDMPPTRKPIELKMRDSSVRDASGCILWTGKLDKQGYGLVSEENHKWSFAHRVAWRLAHGSWPDGVILHRCDVRNCVNVDHMSVGTHADNVADAIKKGRLDNRGEGHGYHKLTETDVLAMRKDYAEGATQVELSNKYNIAQSSVSLIVRNIGWKHV